MENNQKIYIGVFAAVVVIVVSMYVFHNYKRGKAITESFGMLPSFQVKVDRTASANSKSAKKDMFFSVPGTYQALLNPRFSNVGYGSKIRYNMPPQEYQASPCDPLSFNSMIKENYSDDRYLQTQALPRDSQAIGVLDDASPQSKLFKINRPDPAGGNTGVVSCKAGGLSNQYIANAPLAANYSSGNYGDVLDKAYQESGTEILSQLPVGDMTTVNQFGESEQPVIMDRYMYANRNSRLRGRGDMFRGDLPIIPAATGWFRPSVIPQVDLQLGAMNVMGGTTNETATALAEMVNRASGGEMTAIGGVDMTNQLQGSLSAAQNDISFTAFP